MENAKATVLQSVHLNQPHPYFGRVEPIVSPPTAPMRIIDIGVTEPDTFIRFQLDADADGRMFFNIYELRKDDWKLVKVYQDQCPYTLPEIKNLMEFAIARIPTRRNGNLQLLIPVAKLR